MTPVLVGLPALWRSGGTHPLPFPFLRAASLTSVSLEPFFLLKASSAMSSHRSLLGSHHFPHGVQPCLNLPSW